MHIRYKFPFAVLALLSVAATTIENAQMVEIKAFLNARSEQKFRQQDDNRMYLLSPGTKAFIKEIKNFKNSNYGLCLIILNADVSQKQNCYWVYFNHNNVKSMDLYSFKNNEERNALIEKWRDPKSAVRVKQLATVIPEDAKAAEIISATPSIRENDTSFENAENRKFLRQGQAPMTAFQRFVKKARSLLGKLKTPVNPEYSESNTDGATDGGESQVSIPAAVSTVSTVSNTTIIPNTGLDNTSFDSSHEVVENRIFAKNPNEHAEAAIIRIDTLKSPAKNIDPGQIDQPIFDCNGKCTAKAKREFDERICKEKNSYFTTEIENLKSTQPDNFISKLALLDANSGIIKKSCVEAALFDSTGPFMYCGLNEQGKAKKSVPKSCIDTNYSNIVTNSFNLVGQCLGSYLSGNPTYKNAAVKDLFGLMAGESGLHINAKSREIYKNGELVSGGAGGPGQLTYSAIEGNYQSAKTASQNELMINYINENNNSECQIVKDELNKKMNSRLEFSCDRIRLTSIVQNMALTLGHQKTNRSIVKSQYIDNKLNQKIFGNLSAFGKDSLERQLAVWMHNAGSGAFAGLMRSYLPSIKTPLKDTDLERFMQNAKKFLLQNVDGRYTKSEPVEFLSKIQNLVNILDKSAGEGSCLRVGEAK